MRSPTICPNLGPGISDVTTRPTCAVYCRLPDGRIRIPSRDELSRFCLAGHFRDCPGYRPVWLDNLLGGRGASR
jgi:hypothetical protein